VELTRLCIGTNLAWNFRSVLRAAFKIAGSAWMGAGFSQSASPVFSTYLP
jgi:hypothetical protein